MGHPRIRAFSSTNLEGIVGFLSLEIIDSLKVTSHHEAFLRCKPPFNVFARKGKSENTMEQSGFLSLQLRFHCDILRPSGSSRQLP